MEEKYFQEIKKQEGMVGVQVQNICRSAGIHVSTFFRHYRNMYGMVKDVRNEIDIEYRDMLKKVVKHGGGYRDVIYETFKYIEQHKGYFETAATINNTVIFEKMGKRLWKCAKKTRYQYGMKRIEKVYIYEIIGILLSWIEDEKFNPEKIDQYVAYIMKISSGGINRLSLFADKE